jgi:hypothetical protein
LQSWNPDREIFWEVDVNGPGPGSDLPTPADGIREAEGKVAKLHGATRGVFEEDWVIVGFLYLIELGFSLQQRIVGHILNGRCSKQDSSVLEISGGSIAITSKKYKGSIR